MSLDDFLDLLEGVRRSGSGYVAKCPAHDDGKASLSVSEGDTGILVKCFAECEYESILAELGLEPKDLFYESGGSGFDWGQEPEAVYTYTDELGRALYDVVRFPGKEFRQRRYIGTATEWGLGETRRVLYRLPELLGSDQGRWVFLCEGEKDVEAIWAAGGIATCNVGGAGKWQEDYSEQLRGRYVRIVADRDTPGEAHARAVKESLRGIALQVEIVQAIEGKDASDHLAAGGSLNEWAPLKGLFVPLDLTVAPPPVDWLVDGLIAKGDVVLLSGASGLGKSWWTMGLTVALVDDHPEFLKKRVGGHGRVLYVDEENPRDVVYSRLKGLGMLGHERLRYLWNQGIRIDRDPGPLVSEGVEYEPSLIVIDSLTRVHSKEENSVGEMSPLLNDVVRPLARKTGAAVILIHHHDKAGHGPRGSGDILASVDTAIDIFKANEPGVFISRTSKSRRVLTGESMVVKITDLPGGIKRLDRLGGS